MNVSRNLENSFSYPSQNEISVKVNLKETLEGRRIVDIKHLFSSLQSIIHHQGFNCTFRDLEFLNEIRKGCLSTFQFKCKVCGIKENINSENDICNSKNVNTY